MPTATSTTSSCPCCSFAAFNDNIFLPPGVAAASAATLPDDETASSSAATAAAPTPLNDDILPDLFTVWEQLLQSSPSTANEEASNTRQIRLVDTHGHAHLEGESQEIYQIPPNKNGDDAATATAAAAAEYDHTFVSLSCAVEPQDWPSCIQHASQSNSRMAALGVHPWYLANLPDKDTWLDDLEHQLQQHKGIMVGEIGLCKVARFVRTYEHGKAAALAWQRQVFEQQFDLAAAYQRPVSIHCVHQQQILLDALKARSDVEKLPPAIALHSFTGTAHHIDQLFQWEASLRGGGKRKKGKDTPSSTSPPPKPLLYIGFSHIVNYGMCSSEKSRRQGRDAIRKVPPDRLLAESDVHSTRDSRGATALAMAYLAWALEEPIAAVAQRTTANALRFFQSIQEARTERKD